MGFDNVYNSPEKHNLEIVFARDIAGSYEFNIFVVWKLRGEETYYYAQDSGCSCPIPFENYNGISDLTPIQRQNMEQFQQDAARHLEPSEIRTVRQAVFRAHFGRKQGQTKKSIREQEQQATITELTNENKQLQNEVTTLRVDNIALRKKLEAVRKAVGS